MSDTPYWIFGFGSAAITLLFMYANGLLTDSPPKGRFWRYFR
jgi:hypothetical protein